APGLLSASGYFFLNDSDSAVMDEDDFPVERDRPGCADWYFFAYADDYKQALRDLRLLSGPAPIPTHHTFGIIFSRWPAFTESEVKDMARDFAANGYPLATLVMDMEWHKEGWGHWEFDPELIPDPERFFALCRKYGLEVTFNDHPLDVRDDDCHYEEYVEKAGPDVEIRERDYNGKRLNMARVDICDKQQNCAFCESCHKPIMDLGLDYWWNDGSRGQMRGTCGQLVCNKTFFEESEQDGRRGMLLARHGGLGSHRYGGFFTGDANSDWNVLRLQVEFNIRAAGVGVGHVSHDIGGFMIGKSGLVKNREGKKIVDPGRYLRWLQFGVFGPILRFHSSPGSGSRLPYDYDSELGGACRHWLRIRHSLLPYIYTAARQYYETGIPITRGLFLDEPDNPKAYRWDEYKFGDAMFVAPVLGESRERTVYLPAGSWLEFESTKKIAGDCELTRDVELDDFPVYVRAGSIIPRRNPNGDIHAPHIQELWLDVYPGADGAAELYEDDGRSTDYKGGAFCRTAFTLTDNDGNITVESKPSEGKPLGENRELRITLRSAKIPKSVSINGESAPFEATSAGLEIGPLSVTAAEAWTLKIE
ncbi:MAG: TIM-barrel domain-containing protein, partial [bacterium]